MNSPFDVFRRHQRVSMVIITGMAMISFVLFGLVDSYRQVPPALMAIFLAAVFGCAMWVAGLTNSKSSEWGVMGAILGGLLGVLIAVRSQPQPAAEIAGGNLTQEQFYTLQLDRNNANQFMFLALDKTKQGQFPGFRSMPSMNTDARRDLVFCELLNREADRLQIAVPDEAVIEFIKKQTNDKLSKEQFEEIRTELRVNDKDIIAAIKRELRASQAFNLLYGNIGGNISPALRFDYFKKMNVKQSAEIVAIPVKEFEAGLPEPTSGELEELFTQYRVNFPNQDEQGRPEEGRPGFRQPTRVKAAYLEATLEAIQATVGEVTDAEIEERYNLQYKKALPGANGPGLPELPDLDGLKLPERKAEPAAPAETPAATPSETPATPEPAAPAAESTPAPEPATPSENPAPPAEGTTPEPAPPAEKADETSAVLRSNLSEVALLQEPEAPAGETPAAEVPASETKPETPATPAAETNPESPATTEPAPETPATEKPAEGAPAAEPAPPATPAEGTPAETTPVPAGEEGVPPAPTSSVPPLDDALKAAIREDILQERARPKMQELITAAREFVTEQTYNHTAEDPQSEKYLSAEKLAEVIKKYADEHNLVYVETSWLSYQDLVESEDYPLGRAFSFEMQFASASQLLFTSGEEDVYRPMSAQDFRTSSQFLFWKTAHKRDGIPEKLDEELVKEAVIASWKQSQALPKARERADAIVAKLKGASEEATKLLAEETVTGSQDSLYLTVKPTGSFSWMQRSMVPAQDLNNTPPVRVSTVTGAEDAGERFMQQVCEEMQPGEVRVVPSFDDATLYVVKLLERSPDPAKPEGNTALRQQFLVSGNMPEYMQLGYEDLRKLETLTDKWTEDLWSRYDVRIPSDEVTAEEAPAETAGY